MKTSTFILKKCYSLVVFLRHIKYCLGTYKIKEIVSLEKRRKIRSYLVWMPAVDIISLFFFFFFFLILGEDIK